MRLDNAVHDVLKSDSVNLSTHPVFTPFSVKHSMARKTLKNRASGRAASKVMVSGGPSFTTRPPASQRPRSRSAPRRDKKRLRDVTRLMATMELFVGEVQQTYRKWITSPPTTTALRRKCSEDLRLLANNGDSVRLQYRDVRFETATEGASAAGPVEDVASYAMDIAETAGCEQILERLIAVMNAVADRMDVPYSAETQNQITDDWRAMNKLAEDVRNIATAVRTRCRDDVPRLSFPNPVRNAITSLKEQVQLALSGMASMVAGPAQAASEIEGRIAAIVERANGLAAIFLDLRRSLAVFVKQHLEKTKQCDISLANEIDYLLETVGFLIGHATSIVDCSASRLEAARTLDPDLPDGARKLDEALRVMQDEHEALQAMLAREREIVAHAPYRYFRRTQPLPEWSAIDEKDREIVAAMVQLRNGDPNGELAWTTQAMIETAMGHRAGRSPSSSVFKGLRRLEDDHQIVGRYSVPRSQQQQHGVNHFWINEDAFEKYRPHVLGRGGKAT